MDGDWSSDRNRDQTFSELERECRNRATANKQDDIAAEVPDIA